ncbi:hypothetical protein [Aliiglaciecola sp. M165]|uniref:hypothetical protein n=1 Tax=Aliiglaciecola sp. M165 TaxID=2593649 RepID=UPI00117D84FE|nr:hypothetical protein [Aliiglaciecola sp. M165]TRY30724.1 hypothetical protein FM019_12600 [Aliiglaciecola sp. M165]
MKTNFTETLEIEFEGQTFVGLRVVTGKRKLEQTIYFKNFSKRDPAVYEPHELHTSMKGIANHILWELVSGRNI